MQHHLASGSNEIPAELFCIVSLQNSFGGLGEKRGKDEKPFKNNLPLFTFYMFSSYLHQ